MIKEDFVKNIIKRYEDTYTDFFYFEWIEFEEGVRKLCSFLIGDVTQIESKVFEDSETGFRSLESFDVLDENNNKLKMNFGFCASINNNPIIYRRWKDNQGKIFGETADEVLHRFPEQIYFGNEINFIEAFSKRQLAQQKVIDNFWDKNSDWILKINL